MAVRPTGDQSSNRLATFAAANCLIVVPEETGNLEVGDNVDVLRDWLAANVANVHPVGRNGMHRYNNQDHSMYTAMLTVENIVDGTTHDVWEVNVEAEYHEEVTEEAAEVSS